MTHHDGHEANATLRLLIPQWQGGGNHPTYALGAKLLAWLAPASSAAFEEVPISLQTQGLAVDRGIFAREVVLEQARAAKRILERRNPKRVVVFGGECSVDFAPFAYLSERYDDLAVLWLDAHPDVNLPGDNYYNYPNFHAMVVSALLGIGDPDFVAEVPKPIKPDRVMYVGLRALLEPLNELREKFNISIPNISADQVEHDSSAVLEWLRNAGTKHVAVHFDLDVLDPRDFTSAFSVDPNGLRAEAAIRLLADVSKVADVVGLGITEYMPRDAMLLSDMLRRLPLVSDT
jgi:arginase